MGAADPVFAEVLACMRLIWRGVGRHEMGRAFSPFGGWGGGIVS